MESDAAIRALLEDTRTIAVLGLKRGEGEDAYRVPRYLFEHGYRVLPVNPKLAGEEVFGERAVASLAELPVPVDLVNVFRAPRFVPGHAGEILALEPSPRAVWLQLGIRNAEAAARLEERGIRVVQDRCLMVEHRRLLGARAPGS